MGAGFHMSKLDTLGIEESVLIWRCPDFMGCNAYQQHIWDSLCHVRRFIETIPFSQDQLLTALLRHLQTDNTLAYEPLLE